MPQIEIGVVDFVIFLVSWSIILFGMTLATILFFKSDCRKLTNRLLSVLLIVAGLFLIQKLLLLVGFSNQFWSLYVLPLNFILSIPPLIYFYIKFKLRPEEYLQKKDLLHFFIPSIQAGIYVVIGCSSLAFKTEVWENGFLTWLYLIEDVLLPLSIAYYGYAAFQLLKAAEFNWSIPIKPWLFHLLKVLLAILTVHLLFMLYGYLSPIHIEAIYYLHFFLLLSFLLFTTIKAWDQYFPERIYQLNPIYASPTQLAEANFEHTWFETKTEFLFEKEQIFLNPDLNLALLCKAYGLSKRSLSEYTQSVMGKNINELINHYRIQYVLKCLEEGQHVQYNILSIGYSAGFASKSTFYRVFKNMTGRTPSEYIDQLGGKG